MSNPAVGEVHDIQQGEGKPVILIHGLAASRHDWDSLVPALADSGYLACALDLLGHGESYKPNRLEEYTIENVFQHMAGWMESLHLSDPSILIGHSLGGYLALEYALRFPETVRALVLVNPFYSIHQLSKFLQFIFSRPLMNTTLIEKTPYWLFRIVIDVSSLQFGNTNDGVHALPESVRIQTALDYKRAAPGIYNIPRTLRDLTPDLPRIQVPALIIWGARDKTLAPASFRKLVEALPNGRGKAIPPCGHVVHQCHPVRFNREVLDFLSTV